MNHSYGSPVAGAVNSPPPPPPPPKSTSFSPGPPPLPPQQPYQTSQQASSYSSPVQQHGFVAQQPQQQVQSPPGGQPVPPSSASVGGQDEQWLPDILRDKSKADLQTILNDPALLTSLLNAPSTTHPSLPASQAPLEVQLAENLQLANHILSLEAQIHKLRSSLTPALVRVATLERQFRAKQEAMDDALAPWAPKAVHTRLGQSVNEQEAWCRAMEESFLDGAESSGGGGSGGQGDGGGGRDGDGRGGASDREVTEWLRRYKEGRKLLELRREKKLRLEEGRVSGWK